MKGSPHIEPLVQFSGDQIFFRADVEPDCVAANRISKSNVIDEIGAAPYLLHPTHPPDPIQK